MNFNVMSIVILMMLILSGCTSSPSKMESKGQTEVPIDQVEPLAHDLTEDDEYQFGLDLVALEIRNKQFDRAGTLLNKLKKYKPQDIKVYQHYTEFYNAQKDYSMAYVSSKEALKMDGKTIQDEQRFAKFALMTDHYSEAEKVYQHWLDDADSDTIEVTAYNNLGFSALLQKQYLKAKQYFEKAIEKDPLNERARNNLKLIQSVGSQ